MIHGDFNAIMSQVDKHNVEPMSGYEASDLGLTTVNYSGSHFTWSNDRIWTKIDLW